MNAQELITEHLDIWTTAQEPPKTGGRGRGKKKNDQSLYGIKKLRELILDLAVRGKLVEQNPEDLPAPRPGKWFVYVLACEDGSLYKGHTRDILGRWKQHARGRGAEWTKKHPPARLVHWEEFGSQEEAVTREKELKSGFGRKWLHREIKAGRTRQAGEPASVLLEKIAEEKARLIKEKKIKKQKKLPEIAEEEKPFALPDGWKWAKLGDMVEMYNGRAFKSTEWVPTGIPIVRIQNLNDVNASFNYFDGELAQHHQIDNGSFLISWSGTPGTSFGAFIWNRGKAALNQHINNCIFYGERICLDFMRLVVNGCMNHFIAMAQGGVGLKHVTKGTLNNAILGVPPLSEQHRIVAKVDELMALCDQLEQQQTTSNATHQTLLQTLLATLISSADHEAFTTAWERIATHFDILFTTEQSIDQLKQTILQLAVMGKLSCPHSTDTPIEKTLDLLAIEKKGLEMTKKEKHIFEAELTGAKKDIRKNSVKLKARVFCDFITKGTTPAKSELIPDGDVPFLKVYNIVNNQLDFNYRPIFISRKVHQTKLKRSKVCPADVVMNIVGPPLGKVAIVTDEYPEWNMNQALAVFRPLAGIYNRYIYYMLSTDSVLASVLTEVRGMAGQDNLSLEQCRDLSFPIPAIEEQHRIVAKVDELMALCDQLKIHLHDNQTTKLRLADTIVRLAGSQRNHG